MGVGASVTPAWPASACGLWLRGLGNTGVGGTCRPGAKQPWAGGLLGTPPALAGG